MNATFVNATHEAAQPIDQVERNNSVSLNRKESFVDAPTDAPQKKGSATVNTRKKQSASDVGASKNGRGRLESYCVAELSPADISQIPSLKRAPICYRKRVGAIVDGAKKKFGQGFHGYQKKQWSVACHSNPSCTPHQSRVHVYTLP